MSSTATVLVTGVSGYLGSWCMQKCLEAGYSVVGTVRDPDSKKVEFLREAMNGTSTKISPKACGRLTLVKADLLSGDEAWEQVFAQHPDIKYVLHTASPFLNENPKDPNELLEPAINGTTSVLKAAMKHNVKRVVLTSSVYALMEPLEDKTYGPEDWSNPELQTNIYARSKTLAEKAAWDLLNGSRTELTTVNPGFILGPTLYTDGALLSGFESGATISKVITGQMPFTPPFQIAPIDVRDVADVHVRALTKPDAAGKRLVCADNAMWFKDLQAVFAKPAGVKPARNIPACVVSFLALVDNSAASVKGLLGVEYGFDPSSTKQILDIQFTPLETTANDMVEDLRALGI